MSEVMKDQLLKNKRVLEEISRHQWIESEKIGQDIGFEKAAQDWLTSFSKAWMDYHMPKQSKAISNGKSSVKSKDSSPKIRSEVAVKRSRATSKSC